MAEASRNGSEGADRGENTGVEHKTVIRPPNRKKFEEEMESINDEIKALEQEKSKLLSGSTRDHYQSELKQIRLYKDDFFNKRKQIDTSLQKINKDIMRQNSEMTKVESTLKYKSEDRTNETIRCLEEQLKLQNFSLREERRIIKEIDALKRSKNVLVQYMKMKKEIESMNSEARHLREQREHCFKEWTVQKQKEEKLKQQMNADKLKYEQIKKALNELYEKKRVRVAEFKTQMKEYQQLQHKKYEEQKRLREQQKLQRQEAYQKELAEYEATRVPYQDEIQLCQTLIAYLQRFVSGTEQASDKTTEQMPESTQQKVAGMHVLKKRCDEELFVCASRPKCKKNKKEKKRTHSNKPITHSLEIFEQFSQLNITAPTVTAEIPQVLQKLEAAKQHYKELSETKSPSGSWNLVNFLRTLQHSNPEDSLKEQQQVQQQQQKPSLCTSALSADLAASDSTSTGICTDSTMLCHDSKEMCSDSVGMCCSTSDLCTDLSAACTVSVVNCSDSIVSCADSVVSGTDSVIDCCSSKTEASSIGPESAICDDSIPSTPEVQTDNQPPKFLPSSSPTLSLDSGTVSLDSGMEGSKRASSPTTSDNSTLVPDESPPSRSDSIEDARTEVM